jgi:hypothetical protein
VRERAYHAKCDTREKLCVDKYEKLPATRDTTSYLLTQISRAEESEQDITPGTTAASRRQVAQLPDRGERTKIQQSERGKTRERDGKRERKESETNNTDIQQNYIQYSQQKNAKVHCGESHGEPVRGVKLAQRWQP